MRDRRHVFDRRVAACSEVLGVAFHLDVGQPLVDRRVARHRQTTGARRVGSR